MSFTQPDINKIAAMRGMSPITDEEYEQNKKWSLRTAIINIKNVREKATDGMVGATTKAFLLGGRDFIRKSIPIEDAKSQMVLAYIEDEDKDVSYLREYTVWGKMHGAKHGDGVLMEVKFKQSESNGVTYDNYTANKIISQTKRDPATLNTLLNHIAEQVGTKTPGQLTEDDLVGASGCGVIIEGRIVNIEGEPIWEDGSIVDQYPYYYRYNADDTKEVEKQPCIKLGLASEGITKVQIDLKPARYSELLIAFPDLDEIVQVEEGEMFNLLLNQWIRVFGVAIKYTEGEPEYYYIDCSAIQAIDGPTNNEQATLDIGTESDPEPDPKSAEATIQPEPKKNVQEAAQNKVTIVKGIVQEAYGILGDEITLQSFKELDVLEGLEVTDALLAAAINRVIKDNQ